MSAGPDHPQCPHCGSEDDDQIECLVTTRVSWAMLCNCCGRTWTARRPQSVSQAELEGEGGSHG